VAAVDVRKSISFCRKLNVPVLGVVENMSGFVCPKCGTVTPILRAGGGRQIAADMEVPFLGSIPLDPRIAESGDEGRALVSDEETSGPAKTMRDVLAALVPATVARTMVPDVPQASAMQRIAIPLADGRLAQHFGHCECFALVDVNPATATIGERQDVAAPPHQPGLLPPWLAERGAAIIIAGGMGQRAQELFTGHGIRVIVGAPSASPEDLVSAYLAGTLEVGVNTCDH
jgi:ATP-binding protein involved in chromosome partitioning